MDRLAIIKTPQQIWSHKTSVLPQPGCPGCPAVTGTGVGRRWAGGGQRLPWVAGRRWGLVGAGRTVCRGLPGRSVLARNQHFSFPVLVGRGSRSPVRFGPPSRLQGPCLSSDQSCCWGVVGCVLFFFLIFKIFFHKKLIGA